MPCSYIRHALCNFVQITFCTKLVPILFKQNPTSLSLVSHHPLVRDKLVSHQNQLPLAWESLDKRSCSQHCILYSKLCSQCMLQIAPSTELHEGIFPLPYHIQHFPHNNQLGSLQALSLHTNNCSLSNDTCNECKHLNQARTLSELDRAWYVQCWPE